MENHEIIEFICRHRIMPVLVVDDVEGGLKVFELLNNSGLPLAEITFRTPAARDTLKAANEKFPQMLIGAGTIINIPDLEAAVAAGAKFAVAPGCNPEIVTGANSLNLPFFPGIATPTDIEIAISLGCKVMKFFPAEAMGGVKTLKSIAAPFRHLNLKYIPLGGVNITNAPDYLSLNEVAAVGGTWLAKQHDIKNGNWDKIENNIKEAVNLIKGQNSSGFPA